MHIRMILINCQTGYGRDHRMQRFFVVAYLAELRLCDAKVGGDRTKKEETSTKLSQYLSLVNPNRGQSKHTGSKN